MMRRAATPPHSEPASPPPPLVGGGRGEGSGRTQAAAIFKHARAMRRQPTPPERKLWQALRAESLNGLKFRRQMPIGRYIADFYCSSARLIIEVDGVTHTDNENDAVRDAWFSSQGMRVLHFWNNEVMGNLEGVLSIVLAAATPPPGPLPQGEGESRQAPSPSGRRLGDGVARTRSQRPTA